MKRSQAPAALRQQQQQQERRYEADAALANVREDVAMFSSDLTGADLADCPAGPEPSVSAPTLSRKVLAPYKCPVPNYSGPLGSRGTLGMKRKMQDLYWHHPSQLHYDDGDDAEDGGEQQPAAQRWDDASEGTTTVAGGAAGASAFRVELEHSDERTAPTSPLGATATSVRRGVAVAAGAVAQIGSRGSAAQVVPQIRRHSKLARLTAPATGAQAATLTVAAAAVAAVAAAAAAAPAAADAVVADVNGVLFGAAGRPMEGPAVANMVAPLPSPGLAVPLLGQPPPQPPDGAAAPAAPGAEPVAELTGLSVMEAFLSSLTAPPPPQTLLTQMAPALPDAAASHLLGAVPTADIVEPASGPPARTGMPAITSQAVKTPSGARLRSLVGAAGADAGRGKPGGPGPVTPVAITAGTFGFESATRPIRSTVPLAAGAADATRSAPSRPSAAAPAAPQCPLDVGSQASAASCPSPDPDPDLTTSSSPATAAMNTVTTAAVPDGRTTGGLIPRSSEARALDAATSDFGIPAAALTAGQAVLQGWSNAELGAAAEAATRVAAEPTRSWTGQLEPEGASPQVEGAAGGQQPNAVAAATPPPHTPPADTALSRDVDVAVEAVSGSEYAGGPKPREAGLAAHPLTVPEVGSAPGHVPGPPGPTLAAVGCESAWESPAGIPAGQVSDGGDVTEEPEEETPLPEAQPPARPEREGGAAAQRPAAELPHVSCATAGVGTPMAAEPVAAPAVASWPSVTTVAAAGAGQEPAGAARVLPATAEPKVAARSVAAVQPDDAAAEAGGTAVAAQPDSAAAEKGGTAAARPADVHICLPAVGGSPDGGGGSGGFRDRCDDAVDAALEAAMGLPSLDDAGPADDVMHDTGGGAAAPGSVAPSGDRAGGLEAAVPLLPPPLLPLPNPAHLVEHPASDGPIMEDTAEVAGHVATALPSSREEAVVDGCKERIHDATSQLVKAAEPERHAPPQPQPHVPPPVKDGPKAGELVGEDLAGVGLPSAAQALGGARAMPSGSAAPTAATEAPVAEAARAEAATGVAMALELESDEAVPAAGAVATLAIVATPLPGVPPVGRMDCSTVAAPTTPEALLQAAVMAALSDDLAPLPNDLAPLPNDLAPLPNGLAPLPNAPSEVVGGGDVALAAAPSVIEEAALAPPVELQQGGPTVQAALSCAVAGQAPHQPAAPAAPHQPADHQLPSDPPSATDCDTVPDAEALAGPGATGQGQGGGTGSASGTTSPIGAATERHDDGAGQGQESSAGGAPTEKTEDL